MSNSNSVAGFSGNSSARNQFSAQAVATATETALVVNTDTGTATAFVVAPRVGSIRGASSKLNINANQAVTGRSQREYGLPFGESNDQFTSDTWDGRPFKVRITGVGSSAAQLAAPVNDTFTTAATGGTLLDSTAYYYRVAAVNASGGTSLASTETSITTGPPGTNINTVTVKWHAVTGATSYKVYGRTTGGELFMATVAAPTLQFVDDGSITPAGALPAAGTSQVGFKLYQGTSSTLANDHAIGAIAAQSIATAGGTFDFEITAVLQWDSASGILSGWYSSNLAAGSSSYFTTTTVVTNVVTALALADLSFLASVTFGFASPANSITVREFVLEKV
jgi:hypothetical protein